MLCVKLVRPHMMGWRAAVPETRRCSGGKLVAHGERHARCSSVCHGCVVLINYSAAVSDWLLPVVAYVRIYVTGATHNSSTLYMHVTYVCVAPQSCSDARFHILKPHHDIPLNVARAYIIREICILGRKAGCGTGIRTACIMGCTHFLFNY